MTNLHGHPQIWLQSIFNVGLVDLGDRAQGAGRKTRAKLDTLVSPLRRGKPYDTILWSEVYSM